MAFATEDIKPLIGTRIPADKQTLQFVTVNVYIKRPHHSTACGFYYKERAQ